MSKVIFFSLSDGISSSLVGRKALFFHRVFTTLSPWGSPPTSSHSRLQLFLCQLSVGNWYNNKERNIKSTKKLKKKCFFLKKFFKFEVSIFYKDLLINHFKLKCKCLFFVLKKTLYFIYFELIIDSIC